MRRIMLLGLMVVLSMVVAVPAAADIDSNPNFETLVNLDCEGDLFFEIIWSPALPSVVGHDPDGNLVGVAKSFWITDADGNPQELLFAVPGKGFVKNTVWCFWQEPDMYIGAHIMLSGKR